MKPSGTRCPFCNGSFFKVEISSRPTRRGLFRRSPWFHPTSLGGEMQCTNCLAKLDAGMLWDGR